MKRLFGIVLCACTQIAAAHGVTLLLRADDARLERSRVERAYLGHPGGPASDGLELALADARIELEAAGAKLELEVVHVASPAAARDAAIKAQTAGRAALVADLPAEWLLAAADAARLPLLNVGDAADRLREQDCRPQLKHLLPSERMRVDALAQWLAGQRWTQVLLLTGPAADDALRAAAVRKAITRYGLRPVAERSFKLSADPRERDKANLRLLTSGVTYDAIWVVDSDGEFARTLPYRSVLPRPVVGDAGLAALAWAPGFERFGAPQLARRFVRRAGRPMTDRDWSAWIAGKLLVAAAIATPKGTPAALAKMLASAEVDGGKGVSLSLRLWDGQLRQPLLLTDGQGVIASAPLDGMLHAKNTLDALGADAPERLCKSNL